MQHISSVCYPDQEALLPRRSFKMGKQEAGNLLIDRALNILRNSARSMNHYLEIAIFILKMDFKFLKL